MRFNFDGHEYSLEFRRDYQPVRVGVDRKGNDVFKPSRYRYTTVNLSQWNIYAGVGSWSVCRTFTVGCWFREQFSLEQGRLRALSMMTKGNSLSKPFKQAIWQAYITR